MKPVADRLQYCALTHKTGVLRLRAFSPPCVLRLRHRVGIIRRCWRRERSAFSFGAEKERLRARAPGAGGCKGSILLRPLSTGRKTILRRTTCGWFWYFCHQKYNESPRLKAAVNCRSKSGKEQQSQTAVSSCASKSTTNFLRTEKTARLLHGAFFLLPLS